LKLRITRSSGLHITESPLSPDQTVAESDDYFDITATVVDSVLLDHWLRGFGEDIIRYEKKPLGRARHTRQPVAQRC
jgi:hypothetical protein